MATSRTKRASRKDEPIVYSGPVFSYIRFSSARQAAGTSKQRQDDYAAKWASRHNLPLDTTLKMFDKGRSAFKGDHLSNGALGRFMDKIRDSSVRPGSTLIVEAWDRFSRQTPMQAFAQLSEIINAGVRVVTSTNGKEWTPEIIAQNDFALLEVVIDMSRAHNESKRKSSLIQDAYVTKCMQWQSGVRHDTMKGLIGGPNTDPEWVTFNYDEKRFDLIPDKAGPIRRMIELYCEGYGAMALTRVMRDEGYEFGGRFPTNRVSRLVSSRALMGDKVVTARGQPFVLEGYYGDAALISAEKFEELQHVVSKRSSRKVKSVLPGIVTGLRLLWCGHCQQLMVSHSQLKEENRLADGTYRLGARRLRCGSYYRLAVRCKGGESCSAVPVEHAIMMYCSDQMNLDRLLATKGKPDARIAALTKQQAELAKLESRLAEVQQAIESGSGSVITLVKAAETLEEQQRQQRERVTTLEREIAVDQRGKRSTAEAWAALMEDVRMLDYDARMKARQLMVDTFERIEVYMKGAEADQPNILRLHLTSKSGVVQEIEIDHVSGQRIDEQRFNLKDIDAKAKPARAPRTRTARK
ncbi:recombinase family protein [Paraburkholderia sp. Tr-20389]|uniref:recombinase family protein n=1 Tax=Paraburkholderia sp. Tr-20389 TaxID=2703903 RepID=UPI00197F1995|nr:recombinase family protein [Paraburkholderia sp. Tr-20389]MBN3755991.1 recombinase family protein [Paraburkholderia sp. Tr-20389]